MESSPPKGIDASFKLVTRIELPQPSGTSVEHAHRVPLKPEGIVEDKHPTQLKLQEKGFGQNMLKAKERQVINNVNRLQLMSYRQSKSCQNLSNQPLNLNRICIWI